MVAATGQAAALADHGWRKALAGDAHFENGLNVWQGRVTFAAVARDLALDYTPAEPALPKLPERRTNHAG